MRPSWITWVAPPPMTSVLTREGDIHTEERPWEKQAEIRVTRLQAEERLEPQNLEETRARLSLRASRRNQPCQHLAFRLRSPEL